MSRSKEIKEAFQEVQAFLENHRADFGEAFAAARIVFEKASDLAEEKGVDIRKILTGDPVADRALMEAAGVEAEIEATGFSLEAALDLAGALVKLGVVVAGMMA